MDREKSLFELSDGSLELLLHTHENILRGIAETIKYSPWEIWLPIVFQIVVALTTVGTLVAIHRENRRNEYLPYINILHDELNDIILSLYDLFHNPQWEVDGSKNEACKVNYERQFDGFSKGHRYFVRSAIPTDRASIVNRTKGRGRRRMYFNELKKRYVVIYEALLEATRKTSIPHPLYNYFRLTEYEGLYEAYKDMQDI